MRNVSRLVSIGAALLVLGCAADEANAPTTALSPSNARGGGADRLVVMTQNFYVGANVDAILAALATGDQQLVLTVLLQQVQVLKQTDVATRAGALADAIAKTRPHVVGLQEVSQINIDLTWAGIPVVFNADFLPVIMQALQDRGLPYQVAGSILNIDAQPVTGVRLRDYDVMLYDTERAIPGSPVIQKLFENNLGDPGIGVALNRGWVSRPFTVDGKTYQVASTHLEDDLGVTDLSQLRMAQMSEIVQTITEAKRAVIMGDLNDNEGSAMYQVASQNGYADLWRTLRPGTTGFTCCHEADLSNPRPDMKERIDFIFARGFEGPPGRAMGKIDRVNYNPSEKVKGPFYRLWTSDHAGLVGTLLMP